MRTSEMSVWKHISSGKLYKFVAVARPVSLPTQPVVVYSQMYYSKIRGTNIPLPKGTCWTRDLEDFLRKFEEVTTK